jgi:predicted metal-dependent hydrolase
VDAIEQPQSAVLGNRDIAFVLKRTRRRRTIAFTVDGNGLVVSAPWNASESRIKRSMLDAADWILKKLDDWSDHRPRQQRWSDGEQIVLLGRSLELKIVADAVLMPAVLIDEYCLQVTVADPESEARIREAAIHWYRRHAARNFSERTAQYASAMRLPAPKMFLSGASDRNEPLETLLADCPAPFPRPSGCTKTSQRARPLVSRDPLTNCHVLSAYVQGLWQGASCRECR